ncbi:MAG: PAS domain S-box protein [Oscillochloris sp.]|nr:PAS domain S-box protein [Oscillochloris sp.]
MPLYKDTNMKDDPRIAAIIDILTRMSSDGESLHIDIAPTDQGDRLDTIIEQLKLLADVITNDRKKINEGRQRFEEFLDVISGMAALDFTRKASIGEEGSIFDAMAFGLNTLSEELAASTVSRSDMDRIFESMLDALVVANEDGTIHTVNRATTRLFGHPRETLIGKQINVLFVDAHDAELIAARIAQEGAAQRVEATCRTASGSVSVSISASALDGGNHGTVYILRDITERKRTEETLRQNIAQEETIRAQAAALAELSTPLIPISDAVVVMPLVGGMDSRRAQQVLETLLEGIATNGAEVAILDITGVPLVDTHIANTLIHAAQAVRLLGAQVMLTGIRPEVAQTLVGLGIDLRGIVTHSTLQNGIAAVLRSR